MMKSSALFILRGVAVLCLFLCASCAGVKCSLKSDQVKQPVSFTPFVYDEKGNIVEATPDQIKAHFKFKKHFWAMLWRSYALTDPDWELSENLKNELSRANGDAIVNMTVRTHDDGMMFFVTYLMPIIPNCQTVTVEGDVARFSPPN